MILGKFSNRWYLLIQLRRRNASCQYCPAYLWNHWNISVYSCDLRNARNSGNAEQEFRRYLCVHSGNCKLQLNVRSMKFVSQNIATWLNSFVFLRLRSEESFKDFYDSIEKSKLIRCHCLTAKFTNTYHSGPLFYLWSCISTITKMCAHF